MKIIITILIFFTNFYFAQKLTKSDIDKYVSEIKLRNYAEIHEGFIDNKPYSFSVERNNDKTILGINESTGRNKILRTEYYYLDGKLIFLRNYMFNRKNQTEYKICKIYPTLNIIEQEKNAKCRKEQLIKDGNWIYLNNKE
jgi:hypothetical protein